MAAHKIKVIIADDHTVFLDGLKSLIEPDSELEVIGQAENGKELVAKATDLNPDVIVTDIVMPGMNGIEAIKQINESKATPCLALSTFDDESLIMDAIDAGAIGYVLKNAQKGEIIKGIKTVNKFQPFYCKATETKIVKIISRRKAADINKELKFSERDIEVIRMIAKEISSEEIGKNIFLSKRTVDGIRARLLDKMKVKSPIGMIIYALQNNLISLEEFKNDNNLPQ